MEEVRSPTLFGEALKRRVEGVGPGEGAGEKWRPRRARGRGGVAVAVDVGWWVVDGAGVEDPPRVEERGRGGREVDTEERSYTGGWGLGRLISSYGRWGRLGEAWATTVAERRSTAWPRAATTRSTWGEAEEKWEVSPASDGGRLKRIEVSCIRRRRSEREGIVLMCWTDVSRERNRRGNENERRTRETPTLG